MREDRGGVGYLLVGQPGLSSQMARALATKGDQPQLIEGRYQLGITSLDLTAMEYRWLRRSVTYEHFLAQAAVAAQFGIIAAGAQLSGRSSLIVVESVILTNTTAGRLGYFVALSFAGAGGVGAGATPGGSADDRSFGSTSALKVASGTNAVNPISGAGIPSRFISLAAGTSQELEGPWVLSGKDNGVFQSQLVIATDTVNVSCNASLRWWERELLASEQ